MRFFSKFYGLFPSNAMVLAFNISNPFFQKVIFGGNSQEKNGHTRDLA